MYNRLINNFSSYKRAYEEKIQAFEKRYNLVSNPQKLRYLLNKGRINQRFYDTVLAIYNATREVLAPERFDIQFCLTPKFSTWRNEYGIVAGAEDTFSLFEKIDFSGVNLILHYPEVTVTNSKGSSIVVKDIFVKLEVRIPKTDEETIYIKEPMGVVSTVDTLKFRHNYRHSHLQRVAMNSSERMNFTRFCLGTASEIEMVTYILNGEKHVDSDNFKLLLFNIETYLQWESLEGVPYVSMDTLTTGNRQEVGRIEADNLFKQIKKTIERAAYYPEISNDINWIVKGGRLEIVDDAMFDETLLKLTPDTTYHCLQDNEGNYYREAEIQNTDVPIAEYPQWVPFRGQKIHFKVEDAPKETSVTIEKKYFVHPTIKKHVKRKLEYFANLSQITKTRVSG